VKPVGSRAAGRLKILFAINFTIKNFNLSYLEINRKKTDNVYQLPTTAHVISLKRKTIISQTVCAVMLWSTVVYAHKFVNISWRESSTGLVNDKSRLRRCTGN